MNNLKVGDIIEFIGDELVTKLYKEEVRGICGSVVFTREIFEDGSTGNTDFRELEDLITFGWTLPASKDETAEKAFDKMMGNTREDLEKLTIIKVPTPNLNK